MFFDARAYLEKLNSEVEPPAQPAPSPASLARLAGLASAHVSAPENPPSAKAPEMPCDYPYGRSIAGNPKTWTGKIISLDEWRRATEWERHGSTGKMWNGLTQQWEVKP